MASISRYPMLRRVRSEPTFHLVHLRGGKTSHSGAGLSFFFNPATAAMSEVPTADREQGFLLHARSRDFQDVTVQATIAYRFVEPELAASRYDFSIDLLHGEWRSEPLLNVGNLLVEMARQPALQQVAMMTMAETLAVGVVPIRDAIAAAMAADNRLADRGIEVTDIRLSGIRVEPELERALQATTREQVQQEADRATFERRAIAVENERAIAENELHSQIELARRQEDLVLQQGTNARQRATEEAKAALVSAEAKAERDRLAAQVAAETKKLNGEAQGHFNQAVLAPYNAMNQGNLLAMAVKDLAGNLPKIDNLSITPELLTPLLNGLATRVQPEPERCSGHRAEH